MQRRDAWLLIKGKTSSFLRRSLTDRRIGLPLSLTQRRFVTPIDGIHCQPQLKKERKIHFTSSKTNKQNSEHASCPPTPIINLLSFLFWVPCPSLPEAAFLNPPLVMSFLPLIKIPFSPFLVMSISMLLKTLLPVVLLIPFPAFFEPLFPALLVAISLTSFKTLSLALYSLFLSLTFYSLPSSRSYSQLSWGFCFQLSWRFYSLLSTSIYPLPSSSLTCNYAYP